MPRSIALVYGIAGAVVAAAVLIVTASTTGLFDGSAGGDTAVTVASARGDAPGDPGSAIDPAVLAGDAGDVEYVYVNAPAGSGEHGDDDDDEHEEHDDDDHDDD